MPFKNTKRSLALRLKSSLWQNEGERGKMSLNNQTVDFKTICWKNGMEDETMK